MSGSRQGEPEEPLRAESRREGLTGSLEHLDATLSPITVQPHHSYRNPRVRTLYPGHHALLDCLLPGLGNPRPQEALQLLCADTGGMTSRPSHRREDLMGYQGLEFMHEHHIAFVVGS